MLAALEKFEAEVTAQADVPALMDSFPFDFVAEHVNVDWQSVSRLFMGNWARSVRERAHGLPTADTVLAADGPAIGRETALQ